PSELQTSVRFFVPLSRRASIRQLAKRCPTLKPAIATVAPSLTSATACWGDATVLSMALLSINRDGVRSRYLIQFAGRPARRLCDSLPRCQTSWLPASVPHSSPLSSKDLRIDYVDRLALQPRHQPGDRAAVDALVTLLLAVAEVRSADDVLHLEQRVGSAHDRLGFVDVDRREAGPAFLQRRDQRALRDNGRAAGVDKERGRLHAREVGGGDDAARLLSAEEMQAHDVGVLEERLAARRDLETLGLGACGRALAAPAHDFHAEGAPHAGRGRADVPE